MKCLGLRKHYGRSQWSSGVSGESGGAWRRPVSYGCGSAHRRVDIENTSFFHILETYYAAHPAMLNCIAPFAG